MPMSVKPERSKRGKARPVTPGIDSPQDDSAPPLKDGARESAVKEELSLLVREFEAFSLPQWDYVPDIGLYMDQVLGFMEKQSAPTSKGLERLGESGGVAESGKDHKRQKPGESRSMTASMINNYAKGGVIPRAMGKKYSRSHLALLLAVANLKGVLPVSDLADLLACGVTEEGAKRMYESLRSRLHDAMAEVSERVESSCSGAGIELSASGLAELALVYAAEAEARRRAAAAFLAVSARLRSEND